MKAVYCDSTIAEKEAKKQLGFPEFIMMENAAAALERKVLKIIESTYSSAKNPSLMVLCGEGNNGADGLALCRRVYGKINCTAVLISYSKNMKTTEGQKQLSMAEAAGVPVVTFKSAKPAEPAESPEPTDYTEPAEPDIIVDCIYGTGFHGAFTKDISDFIQKINSMKAVKIACDVPSGISRDGTVQNSFGKEVAFKADFTVTMGALKTALFSDAAKNYTGKISVADLGLSRACFESFGKPDAYVFEKEDQVLPLREKPSTHKGNYGHTAVILGEKCGAGFIASEAALKFGTGLVTCVSCVKNENPLFSPENFKISPEIMLSETLPSNTTAVLLGSGLGRDSEKVSKIVNDVVLPYIRGRKPAAIVLDADIFYYSELLSLLNELEATEGTKVILTPHPKELLALFSKLKSDGDSSTEGTISTSTSNSPSGERTSSASANNSPSGKTTSASTSNSPSEKIFSTLEVVPTLDEIINHRFDYAKEFGKRFKNIVLLSKGAVNYIVLGDEIRIISDGTQALAKAGSGDVLAGLCASLLSQTSLNYDALTAACTACSVHAIASQKAEPNFSLTPLQLINTKLF